ncbi:hypothetical protein CLV59_103202 [Chitinophaga dinghuensis]|uniref:Uncharacterized protein n=1 Tax=Chitinophaga dinghuensis TaxID=1539050 RepID=A0A327W1P6_9BACT|nr:hypothetical protein CLV59_103202 [Chitinophaga dinghuensis]
MITVYHLTIDKFQIAPTNKILFFLMQHRYQSYIVNLRPKYIKDDFNA